MNMVKNTSIISIILCCFIIACRTSNTPKQYRNNTTVPGALYALHRAQIADSVKRLILQKAGPYYTRRTNATTRVIVDTILYSPSRNKVSFFIIVENDGSDGKRPYDANCFVAYLSKDSIITSIRWMPYYNLELYSNLKEISRDIRLIYFKKFKGTGSSNLKYNLDDVRFWDDPYIWNY